MCSGTFLISSSTLDPGAYKEDYLLLKIFTNKFSVYNP